MKKLIIVLVLVIISVCVYAQSDKPKSPFITCSGGIWVGFNQSTTFIGFVGPKIAVSFSLNQKTKLECGINGIPGAALDTKNLKDSKLGLAIGSTLMLKRDHWKMKPIIGAALLRTDKWQTVLGVGFVF